MRDIDAIRAQLGMDLLGYRDNWVATAAVGVGLPIVLAASSGEVSAAAPMVVAIGTGILIGIFSSDRATGLDRLYSMLPITRRQFINARYVLQLLLAGAELVVLVLALLMAVPTDAVEWAQPLLFVAVGLLVNALMTPLTLRYGAQRAALVLIAVIAVATTGVIFGFASPSAMPAWLQARGASWAITGVFVAVALVAFEVSRRISQRIYAAKDF